MQTTLLSGSAEETFDFGKKLAQSIAPPARILLVGDLGAGKTTLTRGLAVGFGVDDPGEVSSPTFTLVNKYSGPVPVYHVDLYRLSGAETHEIGLDELLDDPRAVVIVEWADRLGDLGIDGGCCVSLTYVDSESRQIEVHAGSGQSSAPKCQ
jgi:tRNA threonylcarbamoyladenosine biosynthesis protein TsaE